MQVCLIQVPYAMGHQDNGGSKGPQRLVEAGAQALLEARGIKVTTVRIERGSPFRDTATASHALGRRLAQAVRQAHASGQLPLILAGSCDASLGIVAGFEHARCGVVWVDAHADFNTPDSTVSGFFAGMSLAILTGHCYRKFWAQIGESTPIDERMVLLVGVRDLSPAAERERLHRSTIQVVSWQEGKPQGEVLSCVEILSERVQEVYLHLDLDALDPQLAPGLVDEPAPGGLSLPQVEEVVRAVSARFRLRAVALTTYNPERDQEEKTLQTSLHLIDLLAECLSR
jgi:arginase